MNHGQECASSYDSADIIRLRIVVLPCFTQWHWTTKIWWTLTYRLDVGFVWFFTHVCQWNFSGWVRGASLSLYFMFEHPSSNFNWGFHLNCNSFWCAHARHMGLISRRGFLNIFHVLIACRDVFFSFYPTLYDQSTYHHTPYVFRWEGLDKGSSYQCWYII